MFGFLTKVIGDRVPAGFTMDAIIATAIFLVLDILGFMVLLSNISVKEKLTVLGMPMSILFVGLMIGLSAKLQ